uniref:Fibronectin type-III domain-containing protein n=1 Tax=Kwoniella bestiolae CBS 10118 TaxID=1296100 RepID=A0A1B9GGX9_9TREE|nr:hypothetical protein I302_01784 [Kwoniella bestiolae CBS 10118]OCF30265.1 hypothetical protein I302_01784 [Kwoniella bestiolae CBS 10118]
MSKRVRSIWIGLFFLALGVVQAGYLSVNMTTATQCGTSIVRWSGDAGPYHLLLTPTEFKEHGYNVWIESIPDGQNSYELLIRQPAGLQYMLTVWGASGIQYAATTDVLTVQPSLNNTSTCFLSDDAILNLYTFSFNLTSNSGSYPPQCSNMSMTWPTSLESNVTSDWVSDNSTSSASASAQSLSPRSTPLLPARGIDAMEMEIFEERDPSSSEHGGNTTHPPTMFGIIPLGNSFSIPITYNRNSKYAKYLPDSSLSDNPTTYTSQGVTHLNWTVDMAKGTRFILVAGIGSQEKWASGGSSSMFTVGQGSSGCIGSEQNGGGAPSVTATTTSGQDNNSPPPPSTSSPVTRTVVASVLSVIGTLVIVGIIFMCRRARNRRKLRATAFPAGKPSDSSDQLATLNNSNSETPLDLIASRNDGNNPPRLSPLVMGDDRTNGSTTLNSTPISPINPFDGRHSKMPFLPPQSTDTYSSPISPIREGTGASSGMIRHPSQDALLPLAGFATNRSGYDSPIGGSGHGTYQSNRDLTSSGTGTYMSTNSRAGRAGPLHLHEHDEQEDTTELKRDTIACLDSGEPEGEGEGGTSTNPRAPSAISAPPGRRRRPRQQTQDQEREVEFRIHRDAGRVQPEQTQEQEVMELPPRYDEVNWEEERERERQTR